MGLSLLFHVKLIPEYLGVTDTSDALIGALKVVLLVDIIIREGAKFSLVPLFVKEENSRDNNDFQDLINGIFNFLLIISLVFVLIIECLSSWIAIILLPSRSMDVQVEMSIFLRLFAPLIIFGWGSTILGAFLNSRKHFNIVAFRNALPPGIAALAFILFSGDERLGYYVAIAYACGFMIYFGWLYLRVYKAGHRFRSTWLSLEELKSLKNTVSLPALGFTIRQVTARILVEVLLVGTLGKGAITLYNSAFRIFSAIQTLIGTSIATTGLPDMAADSIQDNILKLKNTLHRNIRLVLYIAVPLTGILLLGSSVLAQFLFDKSKFDEKSVNLVGHLIFWLSMGTIFSCMIPVLNSGLYAQRAYGLVFRNMVTMAVINFAIAYGTVMVWGLMGIAITFSVTAAIAVANLVFLLGKTGISYFRLN